MTDDVTRLGVVSFVTVFVFPGCLTAVPLLPPGFLNASVVRKMVVQARPHRRRPCHALLHAPAAVTAPSLRAGLHAHVRVGGREGANV